MSVDSKYYQVERNGAIVVWKFHNPPQNLMTIETAAELGELVTAFDEDSALRVGILTSATPGLFIQHFDVSILLEWGKGLSLLSKEELAGHLSQLEPPKWLSAMTSKPVICAINGPVEGGGCEMALGCDFRFISKDAYMAQPEVFLGFPPGGGGTQFMARLLSPARALELCLTGRRVYGDEAEKIGLATKACTPDELMPAVMAFAQLLVEKPMVGLRNVKKAIYEGSDKPLLDGMIRERELFYDSLRDAEVLELMDLYVSAGQNREEATEILRQRLALTVDQADRH